MLKKFLITGLICFGGLFTSSAAPTLGGPTLSSTSGTNSSSGGSLDTNAVIALIEEYGGGGGGAVSNAYNLTFASATLYTNNTSYAALVSGAVQLGGASGALAGFGLRIDTNANGTMDVYRPLAVSTTGAAFADTANWLAFIPSGARWAITNEGGGTVAHVANSGYINYFSTNSAGGGGVSAATVVAIMATNYSFGATNWLGATNYTADLIQNPTNTFVLTNAGTASANGQYYWNNTQGTYTNANGCGMDLSFPPALYITNTAGDYLYTSPLEQTYLGAYITWDVTAGSPPAPSGYFTTNTTSSTGARFTYDNAVVVGSLLKGRGLMFGDDQNTQVFGTMKSPYNGVPINFDEFPPATIASIRSHALGANAVNIGCIEATNYGVRVVLVAVGHSFFYATNAQYFAGAVEAAKVYNTDGVGAAIGSAAFTDYGDTVYAIVGSATFTNLNSGDGVILGANIYNPADVGSVFKFNKSVVGGNTVTNINVVNSFLWGNRNIVSNTADSIVVGNKLLALSVTNVFLHGDGLASTSNNVMKLGFAGWHLLIQTNTLQLISNGVPYNITRTP